MTSLILGHFMNRVVDGIKAGSLGILGNAELILACTSLSSSTLLQVGLGIPNALTQELSKTTGMVGLLKSITLESLSNLGIALTIGLTSHCQIHTDLTALPIEMVTEVVNHLLAHTLGFAVTDTMNGSIGNITILLQFRELGSRSLTNRALLRCSIAFIDISTNGANKLFLHNPWF